MSGLLCVVYHQQQLLEERRALNSQVSRKTDWIVEWGAEHRWWKRGIRGPQCLKFATTGYILCHILQEARRVPSTPSYTERGGCFHTEDSKTPLHLACELTRPEAVIMLLGSGASPYAEDHNGSTPLDVLLEKLGESEGLNSGEERRCLDHLLIFMRKLRFKLKVALGREPERWTAVLGEETFKYLVGKMPAPLLLSAMQTIVKQLSPATFPDSLHELPIPPSLKPLGPPCSQQAGTGRRSSQS